MELNSLEPQQVTVSEGEFILQVDNTVYLGGITVSLDDASAKAVAAKSMPNRSVRYVQTVTLKPGRHRLYVAGKSQLEAIIDVRSKP